MSYSDWLYNQLGGSTPGGSGGGLTDVIVENELDENGDPLSWANIYLLPGVRYIVDAANMDRVDVFGGELAIESEIWITIPDGMTLIFPETLAWIGEPTFEAGKSYIINIRHNVAVACEYTPGVE